MKVRCSNCTFVMISVVAAVGVLMSFTAPRSATAAAADGQRLLQQVVEGARKEGELDLMIVSSQGEKGGKDLIDAFKRRFGLEIKLNADLSGNESQKFNQATVEAKSGIPPTFDLMPGETTNILQLKDAGGAEPIPNWEALLGEIAPEAYKVRNKVSPMGLTGYGFVWSTRTVALLYNTKLISERELPRTWKEMGTPSTGARFLCLPGFRRL